MSTIMDNFVDIYLKTKPFRGLMCEIAHICGELSFTKQKENAILFHFLLLGVDNRPL